MQRLVINTKQGYLRRGDKFKRLSKREGQIAEALALNCPKVLTTRELIEQLWDDPWDEPDWAWEGVRVHLYRLRKKLKALGTSASINADGFRGYFFHVGDDKVFVGVR